MGSVGGVFSADFRRGRVRARSSEVSVTQPVGLDPATPCRERADSIAGVRLLPPDLGAPLVTVPIMAGIYLRILLLAIVAVTALAFVHYVSSIAFYF